MLREVRRRFGSKDADDVPGLGDGARILYEVPRHGGDVNEPVLMDAHVDKQSEPHC
jgi:hypothetical protein